MAALKTAATDESVDAFLKGIEPEEKRQDSLALRSMMEKITGEPAAMWGAAMVGFGKFHYKSERSRQEGDWPLVAFSPRKQNLTLYVMQGLSEDERLLEKLGKHTTSGPTGGCLYIKRLADVDQAVLAKVIKAAYTGMKKKHG